MDHNDHVDLLRPGVPTKGGTWADFGSGEGAFTLALAELTGPASVIYAIDKSRRALQQLEKNMRGRFPGMDVHFMAADFQSALELPPLQGAVMANALHFVRQKAAFLQLIWGYLRPGGRLIIVEYDVDQGNRWVPHPLSFPSWQTLAAEIGFVNTRKLASKPSRFLRGFYSAESRKPVA